MNGWFPIAAALLAECLTGATVLAQPPDLPLSKTALGAVAEVRQAMPGRLESIVAPLFDALVEPELGLSEEWRTHCGKDELTGETTSCFLHSPDYMPVSWEPDSSCRRRQAASAGECAMATYGAATLGSQQLSVYCDGRVRTEMLFTASRFMVGDEVVARHVRTVSDVADAIRDTDDAEDARRLSEELEAAQNAVHVSRWFMGEQGDVRLRGHALRRNRKARVPLRARQCSDPRLPRWSELRRRLVSCHSSKVG